jgi:hypothetical protein
MCRKPTTIKVKIVEGGQPITVIAVNGGAPVLDGQYDGESEVILPAGVTGKSKIVIRPSGASGAVEVTLCANPRCNRAVLSIQDTAGQPAAADIKVGDFQKAGPVSRSGNDPRCFHKSTIA